MRRKRRRRRRGSEEEWRRRRYGRSLVSFSRHDNVTAFLSLRKMTDACYLVGKGRRLKGRRKKGRKKM